MTRSELVTALNKMPDIDVRNQHGNHILDVIQRGYRDTDGEPVMVIRILFND